MTDAQVWKDVLDRLDNIDSQTKVLRTMVSEELRKSMASITLSTAPLAPRRTEITLKQIGQKHHELGRRDNMSPPSLRQQQYVRDLCESRDARVTARVDTAHEASALIKILLDMPQVPEADRHPLVPPAVAVSFKEEAPPIQAPTPRPAPESIPYAQFERLVPDGRYAVPASDGKQILFLRIHTTDKSKGKTVGTHRRISYKSSDMWYLAQLYWKDTGLVQGANEKHGTVIADALTQIAANTGEAAMKYAEHFDECVNCGKELTDDRSRYYHLGTDCIKKRPDLVRFVDRTQGPWYAGAAS